MELKEFIKEALKDILDAVSEAKEEIKNGEIAPYTNSTVDVVKTGMTNYQLVSFEIAVTTDEKKGSKAKLGVLSGFIGAGIEGQSNEDYKSATKLSFKVPVKFPNEE